MRGIFAFVFLLLCCAKKESLIIKGSDTLLPLMQRMVQLYPNPEGVHISVSGGGSGVGIAALLDGVADIVPSSRKMRKEEWELARRKGIRVLEKVVAMDCVCVIVHRENPIEELSLKQIKSIFTGKVKDWSQIQKLPSLRIIPVARDSASGTHVFFKKVALEGEDYAPWCHLQPSNGAILQIVSQTPASIGYIGFAYLNERVKAVKIKIDGRSTLPSILSAQKREYPLTRPLFLYLREDAPEYTHNFVEFALSKRGQEIVEQMGYIRGI
jgi:phosphate transport system substrate-binding protein